MQIKHSVVILLHTRQNGYDEKSQATNLVFNEEQLEL